MRSGRRPRSCTPAAADPRRAPIAAYIIAEIDVTDPEAYKAYTARTPAAIQKYGGKFIVRGGGNTLSLEGAPPQRIVVIEFPDKAAAERFYRAPDYQEILKLRLAASIGRMFIVEGFSPA